MKAKSPENIIETHLKSNQLADLLSMIVDMKGTAENSLADDPLIILARDLALKVTNSLYEQVKNLSAKETDDYEN